MIESKHVIINHLNRRLHGERREDSHEAKNERAAADPNGQ